MNRSCGIKYFFPYYYWIYLLVTCQTNDKIVVVGLSERYSMIQNNYSSQLIRLR